MDRHSQQHSCLNRNVEQELTARQREVLLLIAEGLTAKEIAWRTGLCTKTIEYHKAAIYDRLGVRTTAGLVRYAVRTGLIVESEVKPQQQVFRVCICCDKGERSLSVAFVRAIDQPEAIRKLCAKLPNIPDLEVRNVSVAQGLYID